MNPNGARDKAFKMPLSDQGFVDVKIHVLALRAQGLDLTLWPSTYLLAGLLHKFDIEPPLTNGSDLPVLELGAGTGLVGLMASMIWHRHAVVTDLEPIVPGLVANIDLNSQLLTRHKGSATAGALDWEKPDILTLQDGTVVKAGQTKAHVVMAADTCYSEDQPPILAQTILRWLAPGPRSRLILTLPLRVAYLDPIRELWELLEKGGLEAIQEGKEEAVDMGNDSWDDERLCEWSIWRWK